MTEQTCPDCGRPMARFARTWTSSQCARHLKTCPQSKHADCLELAITRLRSRISSLEEALVVADRMRAAIGTRALGEFGENTAVWAYDAARERTKP